MLSIYEWEDQRKRKKGLDRACQDRIYIHICVTGGQIFYGFSLNVDVENENVMIF